MSILWMVHPILTRLADAAALCHPGPKGVIPDPRIEPRCPWIADRVRNDYGDHGSRLCGRNDMCNDKTRSGDLVRNRMANIAINEEQR